MGGKFWLGVLAYLVPTFPLGYLWHLVVFAPRYHALAMYRDDVIIPLGLASMVIQALIFSWAYGKIFAGHGHWLKSGLAFGFLAGVLSWSFTTLAVGAKNVMTSVPDYILLETAFTVAQFIVVGPLMGLAWRRGLARAV